MLYLLGGVYEVDAQVTFPADVVITNAQGARPVITHSAGKPPRVHTNARTVVKGLWFGGPVTDEGTAVTANNGARIEACVFFGYNQCIAEGGNTRLVYQGNLFVNCGRGYGHAIYISNSAASPEEAARILDNVFIGGGAYQIHLWHLPQYTVIQGNFCALATAALAVDGPGHAVTQNVFWSQRPGIPLWPMVFSTNAGCDFAYNLHGEDARSDKNPREWITGNPPASAVRHDNTFVGNVIAHGSSAVQVPVTELPGLTGYSKAQIDSAVNALDTAFLQDVQSIQADASILPNWALLQQVISIWKGRVQ